VARNRALGSPYQTERVSADFTTDFGVDAYLVEAVPLIVTLDPYAVNHDQVVIQDVTLQAAARPIIINASEGQAINGYGTTLQIAVNGGSVQLTFRDGLWIPALSSGSGGGASTLVFRPGGVPGGNVYVTWTGIQEAMTPGCTVLVDSSLAVGRIAHVPAVSGVTDMTGATLSGYSTSFPAPDPLGLYATDVLQIDDGAQLHNLKCVINGLGILLDSKTTPGMTFAYTAGDATLLQIFQSSLAMTTTATVPGIQVPSGATLEINANYAYIGAFPLPTATPLIFVAAGGTLTLALFNSSSVYNGAGANVLAGAVGATLNYEYDSSSGATALLLPPAPGFLGTVTLYQATLAQLAEPAKGATAGRPVPPYLLAGEMYLDLTLGIPIWWTGAAWINASIRPAGRLAATAAFISPQMRSTGLCSWPAYLGSHRAITRGWSASQRSMSRAV